MMLGIITFRWGAAYTSDDVNRLHASLRERCPINHRLYCVTDDATGLHRDIVHVPQWPDYARWHGCYRRLPVLDEAIADMLAGYCREVPDRLLTLDLDMDIVGDLGPLVMRAEPFLIWRCQSIGRRRHVYNPSFMLMDVGAKAEIFEAFRSNPVREMARAKGAGWLGTDQAIISNLLREPFVALGRDDGLYSWRDDGEQIAAAGNVRVISYHGARDLVRKYICG